MYRVWIKKNYQEIQYIGCRRYTMKVKRQYRMLFTSCTFHNTFKHYFVSPSANILYFCVYFFWSILCTYYGECFMLVFLGCWWDTLIIDEMVKRAWFGYVTATTPKYVEFSPGSWFIHITPRDTIRNNIFISWNICYNWIKFHSHQIWL